MCCARCSGGCGLIGTLPLPKPTIREDRLLEIIDGRHPVLDLQLGNEFVANDTRFTEDESLALITGPNMAGKSTYIRQVC